MSNYLKRILIISVNAIGDTYLSLSGAIALKNYFPFCEIDFIINENSQFLFENLNFVNRIIVNKNIFQLAGTILKISKKTYDYSFNFFPGRLNTLLNIFSKSKIRAGYWNIFRIKDWSLTNQVVRSNMRNKKKYVWNCETNYLNRINLIFEFVNLSVAIGPKFEFPIKEDYAHKYSDYFLLHTCSKLGNRSLSNSNINILIDYLLKNFDKEIVFICSSDDSNLIFLESIQLERISILKDQCINNLVQIIKFSKLFFAIDSFPIHIADAYNTSFLGIFGPTDPSCVLIKSNNSIRFNIDSLQNVQDDKFIDTIKMKITKDTDFDHS